ncbi:MAG: nucleoside transporter C-terminal domain-containing protein [Longimicrobiales bacterium]
MRTLRNLSMPLTALGLLVLGSLVPRPVAATPGALEDPIVAGSEPVAVAPAAAAAAQTPIIRVPREGLDTPLLARLRSLLGLLALTFLAWAASTDRSRIQWRVVGWGLSLQLVFAVFILKTPVGASIFAGLNTVVVALLSYTVDGARFVFGNLVDSNIPVGTGDVATGAFTATAGQVANTGSYFAFTVLPTIIFFSSLMTVLYHLGIMQRAVKGVAWVMQRTMRTSGAETLSAAGNIFVGQTEAPLLIKPFVDRMTYSELMAVMTAGFATVAGGVLAAYVGMLLPYFPDIAGHLIAASVMSAPAALVVAKLMVPESATPETADSLDIAVERPDVNVIDAAARGASEGLSLALNVGAMLLAFVALISLLNGVLAWGGGMVGLDGLTLELILGWILSPLAWLMGVTWADATTVGSLMGIKTVLNEFFAYIQLAGQLGGGSGLEPRSIIIVTYALSGFANFSSIAIQLGGIGGIAPSRRQDLSRLGLRAMVGGSIAAFMTATVAGMIL